MNQEEIKFKTGVFQKFTATRSFALGQLNVTLPIGAELEFDGQKVVYAGNDFVFPQLRGALKAGWLVPVDEYNEGDPSYGAPASANIKMRPPTDAKGQAKAAVAVTLETDERIVMSAEGHASDTRTNNRQQATRKIASRSGVEDQDGVPVRTLQTPAGERAKNMRTVLTSKSAGSALRAAESVQITAGKGITEEEMLARMSEDEQQVYLAKKESLKSRYVDTTPVTVAQVKTAKTKEAEGMKLTQSVGGGIEIADPTGQGGKAKASTRTEDGITFKNTNGPEKNAPEQHHRAAQGQPVMVKDGTADVRRKIAKSMCAEFPESYDFAAPERKKLARLQADFEDRPDVLRAVFACESDAFKVKLIEEFPSAFQG